MKLQLCLAIVCGFLLAADDAEDSQMTDQQLIQGAWRLVGGQRHGKPFSDELLKNATLTFSGDKLATKNKDHVSEVGFKLDPSTSPKQIDVEMEDNVGKGIYELNGDDLRILHGELGDPRASSFDPKLSPTSTLMVLKREKP